MEYKVVVVEREILDHAEAELMNEVNELLRKGWQLQGGISISCHVLYDDEYYNLAQALVRVEDRCEQNNDVQVTLL